MSEEKKVQGQAELSEEQLAGVAGGGFAPQETTLESPCSKCGSRNTYYQTVGTTNYLVCRDCGAQTQRNAFSVLGGNRMPGF